MARTLKDFARMWKEMLSMPGQDNLEKIDKYLDTLPSSEKLEFLRMLQEPQEIPEELKIKPSDKESEQK